VYVVGTAVLENEFRHRGMDGTDELPEFTVLGFDTTLTYEKMWSLCGRVRAGTR
jgi:4-nitrophenyl phosphatase/NagD protein